MAGGRTISVLNVAEKPSVAKSVAGILSRNQGLRTRDGRSRYNRIFEFNYSINGRPCHMLVTSVTGHLMELEFEERYRKWHSCDPADLYQAPVRKFVPEDKLDIRRTLEEEARRCQWLVLWLDCDREGENIAFEVVEVCIAVNPHLTIRRAHFSALIDREIHEAVQHLVEPNKWFADAVDARQEIDLRIGASFTRFQTMLLRDAFIIDSATDDRNLVLSYGPCQFPTLGFIVERYWENQAHEPEEFWTINCSHKSDEGIATFNWMRGHLFDYTCAVIIYEMCVQEPIATVTKVRQQEKLKYPPYPLNTIELEKRASRYFRMSSEHTMKVAEDLYQAGFISYPRTETDSFSQRTDLHAIVQEQQRHPVWGSYAQQLLDPGAGLWRNPGNGGHDDKAHPPIHPTKFFSGENRLSQDHHKNYLDVYRFESWGSSLIPTYVSGQQFTPTSLTLDSGVTRPPPLLSEADLLSCMDKEGIGTDATMHDHIKKLLDRFYATKDSNTRFSPTNLGEALVMGYDDMGYKLWKPYLRAVMERDMKAVSEGTKSKAEVLSTSLQQMKACFLDARLNKVKLFEAMGIFFERSNRSSGDEQHAHGEVVRQCGLCQESDMVLRRNRDGNFMVGCLAFPQCRNAIWLPGSVSEAVVTTDVCNTCTPGPVHLIQFKFRQLEIPPNYNANHLGCIGGCDEILRQLIEICGTGSRIPARGQGSTASSSSVQQSNSRPGEARRGACIYCQQTGHSSSDCPLHVSGSRSAQYRGMNPQTGDSSIPCSTCGTPCTLLTAKTATNRGRKFYSCPSQNCNFFVWEDNLNNGTGGRSVQRAGMNVSASNSSRSSSRGRGGRGGGAHAASTTFVSATGDPISGRRCFVCGDPSHFANACPNRGS
ncbi:DNA topoisomerase 3-alpha isoform X2 [Juglans microcarpa x Juglans regia]|uniref:DNA topoisomerase 3-alpha isoform X2 n=1 Tax=Juglans microcarpa x Juglans regia TaxID=2249226 RepID=UPI001B7E4C85|nr:DNA topoisomerase 3-alpha isoform X2 [Juglans microcarpa x Juglans regia]